MMKKKFIERRSETRNKAEKYSSVEFITNDFIPPHVFPVYDEALTGIGILAREGSAALDHLEVGKIMDAKFTLSQVGGGFEICKVEIRHITKDGKKRYKGHYLIGLSILEYHAES